MPKTNLAFKPDDAGTMPHRRLKILVLDDDEFDRQHVQRLSSKMTLPTEIDEAADLIALQKKLDSRIYDAILVDYRLSSGNGLDALDIIAAHKQNGSAAQIMVAGDPSYELAVKAMKHGCDEFLGKDKLDAISMQKSVLGAILASTKKASAHLNVEIQELAGNIANGVSELCLANMQPLVSSILRKTHALKENEHALSAQSNGAITIIEQSCGVLKDFLETMESKVSQAADPQAKVVPMLK
ncbi:MAG: response regulator [Paracoccaceae bacterium]